MSMNVYFTDKVRESPDFTSKPYRDGSGDRMQIHGISLHSDQGRPYAMFGDLNNAMLDALENFVEEFSFFETIPTRPSRERGVYCHESAEAELELDPHGKIAVYKVKITGKKIEDVRSLFRRIKAGSTFGPRRATMGNKTASLGWSSKRTSSECKWVWRSSAKSYSLSDNNSVCKRSISVAPMSSS